LFSDSGNFPKSLPFEGWYPEELPSHYSEMRLVEATADEKREPVLEEELEAWISPPDQYLKVIKKDPASTEAAGDFGRAYYDDGLWYWLGHESKP
jgi:hypothetical protein